MNLTMFNMQENNRRSHRVASQIKTEISWLIEHRLRDPEKGFITVTRVRLSPDLKIASIYYSVLGNEQDREASNKALSRAKSFLKRELGDRISLRVVPDLRFFYDDSLEYSEKITTLLNKIKKDESDR
jgi:ribosome-binding factor A